MKQIGRSITDKGQGSGIKDKRTEKHIYLGQTQLLLPDATRTGDFICDERMQHLPFLNVSEMNYFLPKEMVKWTRGINKNSTC